MAKRSHKKSGRRSEVNVEKHAPKQRARAKPAKSGPAPNRTAVAKTRVRAVAKSVAESVGKAAMRAGRSASGGRRGSIDIGALSTEALAAELERRRREVPELERRAEALRGELSRVLARVAELTGRTAGTGGASARSTEISVATPGKRGAAARRATDARPTTERAPRRRGGKPTVAENIAAFLRDAAVVKTLREIVDGTARLASREANTSYGVQVSATMRKLVDAGVVRQVGRGQYQSSGATERSTASNDAASNGVAAGA